MTRSNSSDFIVSFFISKSETYFGRNRLSSPLAVILLGLIRFALYPFDGEGTPPDYLEILHLECMSKENRTANPVGFWLIWYACQVSLRYCTAQGDKDLVKLDAVEQAIGYYENKVKMTGLGWTTYPGTGEDVYAFSFTKQSTQQFCSRIEQEYGSPVLQ